MDRLGVDEKMVSEDTEKIIALIIVTFSFLSIPVLLFIFFILLFIDANYFIQYYNTRALADALMAILLAFVNAGIFLFLRFLVKWIRK